jgi:hypothetical protein
VSFWDELRNVISDGFTDADTAASKFLGAAEALAQGKVLDALEDIDDAAFDTANAAFGTEIAEVTQVLHAIGQPIESIGMGLLASMDPGEQVGSTINDVLKGNWRAIIQKIQSDVALIPVLGTAAANVIASGLALYDSLTTPSGIAKVLLLAFDYAMANVPGASAYADELDPLVTALVRLALQTEPPTDAMLDALVQSVPDPVAASILSALVLLLTHRRTIAQTGLSMATDLDPEFANLDPVSQGSDAVAYLVQEGKDITSSLKSAYDAIAADPSVREAWDDFRGDYAALAATYDPIAEEVGALAGQNGLPPDLFAAATQTAYSQLGAAATTSLARVQNLLRASRPYQWALATESKFSGLAADPIVGASALLPVASRALDVDIAGAIADPASRTLLTSGEAARPLLNGVVGGKRVPAGKQAMQAFADILGVTL